MENNQSESESEHKRLEETIALAEKQLDEARKCNEDNKSAIIEAKKELRENTSHSISGLWSSEGFEALAELSQYVNPVTDKIADYEAMENKILLLENLIKSPYFARIDFKFEGEDDYEKIYIGRTSLKKNNTYDMCVYDWRSPIASVFYRFVLGQVFYDAPNGRITGEVALKRQYEIHNGELEYFFDTDVQIVDEFLKKLLSQNTSPKMKTIVETIQKEQDIVIRDMENDLVMVQGVAGSGKTSIALHRAAYLMYQGLQTRLSSTNIMIISPNTLFEQYISNVLPELGENNVVSVVFDDILKKILKSGQIQSRNQFLESMIAGSEYCGIIKTSIEFKTSQIFIQILNSFIQDLPERWIEFEDVRYEGKCIITKEKLKARLSERAETPLGIKLKQLEDFIIELIHGSRKERIPKSEEIIVRKEIQKFTELNVVNLYRKLFSDLEYFIKDNRDNEYIEYRREIFEYTQDNLNSNTIFYDDASALAYLSIKLYKSIDYRDIKQVVIDEAQDYYPLQYEILHLLFSNSKFTILGDMDQTIEKQEDISLYDQIQKILNKQKASLIIMDKSFRCTSEILKFSRKFIGSRQEIKSFNRNGSDPAIYTGFDSQSVQRMIIAEVNSCLESEYRSVGLLCKTGRNALSLYESLKDELDVQLIQNESNSDLHGVFVIPVYMSKGLEFDAVLVCDADSRNYKSEDDKKLLYIACTRALHRLSLFCKGRPSPLI